MAECVVIKGKHRKICAGDLNKKITLQNRAITTSSANVDFTETFTENSVVWSMVETGSGSVYFDSVGVERTNSHKFYIRYITGITSETWILYGGRRYDILNVEDLDLNNDFMLLRAADAGLSSKAASSL